VSEGRQDLCGISRGQNGLSAAGGGVGSFNWRIGREALSKAGLTIDDAPIHFAGHCRPPLAGLVAGQIDGVALHPERRVPRHQARETGS